MTSSQIFTTTILYMLLCACQSNPANDGNQFTVVDTLVSSRGIQMPVTYVQPVLPRQKLPLVVLIHGHGGTRHEAGGFTRVAEGLATEGIASIRMDFSGCGDSSEPFSKNNLTNMLDDILASQRFAVATGRIDTARIGLHGFSVGGRLALMLAAQDSRYKAIGMWAPDAVDGEANMVNFLGGRSAYDRLRTQAKIDGFAPFTTFWGQDQQLGYQWFLDFEKSKPLQGAKRFKGALFVLYGDLDDVISPDVSERLVSSATQTTNIVSHVVIGADHGLGLFNDDFARSEEAVSKTVSFFSEYL